MAYTVRIKGKEYEPYELVRGKSHAQVASLVDRLHIPLRVEMKDGHDHTLYPPDHEEASSEFAEGQSD